MPASVVSQRTRGDAVTVALKRPHLFMGVSIVLHYSSPDSPMPSRQSNCTPCPQLRGPQSHSRAFTEPHYPAFPPPRLSCAGSLYFRAAVRRVWSRRWTLELGRRDGGCGSAPPSEVRANSTPRRPADAWGRFGMLTRGPDSINS